MPRELNTYFCCVIQQFEKQDGIASHSMFCAHPAQNLFQSTEPCLQWSHSIANKKNHNQNITLNYKIEK
jgi:hypothetical protein